MQTLGWLGMPLAMRLFRWLPDRGYTASKALGLLLACYFLWVGASAGFLRNDLGGILFSVLLVAGISAWFTLRGQGWAELQAFWRENRKLILVTEMLFAAVFIAWAVLRAYATFKIDFTGGEKFMEIAFLNAILRSPGFPPLDPWLSGFAISYYYFGYVMMALVTRLSGVPVGIGFDLYDALLFSLTVLGAFGVVYNLVAATLKASGKDHQVGKLSGQPLWTGLLGSLLVAGMANIEGLWEVLHSRGLLSAAFWQWLGIPDLASAAVSGSWNPGSLWSWWWRTSRLIQDVNLAGQPISVSPIDEFPFFSFLLGDNHPHVLALPFVLLAIALAFNLLLRQSSASHALAATDMLPASQPPSTWRNLQYTILKTLSFDGDWMLFIFSALIIGSLGFLNTWDLPIYLGLAVLSYGLGEAFARGRLERDIFWRMVVLGLGLGMASGVLYIFFYVSFGSQASGILPYVFPPTRLPQYLTMFGAFIFLAACFLVSYLNWQARQPGSKALSRTALAWWLRILLICMGVFLLGLLLISLSSLGRQLAQGQVEDPALLSMLGGMDLGQAIRASLNARLRDPWLLLLVSGLLALVLANTGGLLRRRSGSSEQDSTVGTASSAFHSELFVFLLFFTGLALTLLVEFIYLRDSFGVRMNTVFKFYYQAWVMLGLAGAYAIWWLLRYLERSVSRYAFTAGAVLLLAAGMIYPLLAGWSRVEGFRSQPNLDASSNIAQANPDDWAAIQWLNENVAGTPVILEAPSATNVRAGSYRYEGRISAFTGLPTVLGWSLHESQWRGDFSEQSKREPDIATIYTTSDGQLALDLLRRWGVKYIILGNPERNYIQQLCSDPALSCNTVTGLRKFELFFEPVFNQGAVTIYAVP